MLEEAVYRIRTYVGVDDLRIEPGDLFGLVIDAVHTVGRPHPDILLAILVDGTDVIVADRRLVVHLVLIDLKLITVIPVSPVSRPEPDISFRVLEDIENGNLRKTVFHSEMREKERPFIPAGYRNEE